MTLGLSSQPAVKGARAGLWRGQPWALRVPRTLSGATRGVCGGTKQNPSAQGVSPGGNPHSTWDRGFAPLILPIPQQPPDGFSMTLTKCWENQFAGLITLSSEGSSSLCLGLGSPSQGCVTMTNQGCFRQPEQWDPSSGYSERGQLSWCSSHTAASHGQSVGQRAGRGTCPARPGQPLERNTWKS